MQAKMKFMEFAEEETQDKAQDALLDQQLVADLVEATEGIDIVTEKKWEAAVTLDEEPRAELSDTKEEHVDAAEDKISAEFVEATEEIDNVPELNVEAATIQQDQPPLADDETDEQLHEAADDQIAAELVEAVQDLEKTATLAAGIKPCRNMAAILTCLFFFQDETS
jgi:hypothetical protein